MKSPLITEVLKAGILGDRGIKFELDTLPELLHIPFN
jgi:hypothetical protein